MTALEEMKANPFAGDVRPIQGEVNLYRRRVGSYRIYFRPLAARRLLDVPEINRKQSR
jgi:mRNA-degrading endonuclease RelE of RelBE toxin-antitoxin system